MKDSVAAALILDNYFSNPQAAAAVRGRQWAGGRPAAQPARQQPGAGAEEAGA